VDRGFCLTKVMTFFSIRHSFHGCCVYKYFFFAYSWRFA
jgi:hypothetical protein